MMTIPTNTQLEKRINDMGTWASKAEKKLDAIGALVRGILATDESEFNGLVDQLQLLEGRLIAAPDQRKAATTKLLTIKDQIASLEAQRELVESNVWLDVCSEINGDGKSKYTNESQRKAALSVDLSKNAEPANILTSIAELETEKARAEAELAYIEDAFKTDRIVYHGSVARLENLTARIQNQKEN